MQEKKPTKNYDDLPDTIGITDYMEWRGVGRAIADAVFHQKKFPRLNTGSKLLADKRAVLLYEMGLQEEEKQIVLVNLAKQLV